MTDALRLARSASIPYARLCQHVAIFGASGTGKTTTAATIVERAPCPVVVLDAKGDLGAMGQQWAPWFAQLRIDAMGADAVARALELSEAQAGAVAIAMAWAEDNRVPVRDMADLRHVLETCDPSGYGLMSTLSVSATMRAMLRVERGHGWTFGGNVVDWRDAEGINVIDCQSIADAPGLYGTYAMGILDSLYRGLGEAPSKAAPGLMVVIDEAHLLFADAPASIVRRIEQIVRLIRSKGVALVFITQSPSDLPDAITGQISTRIQHGLRAATASQMRALRSAAESMRGGSMGAIQALGIGQALVSVPDAMGVPSVARVEQIERGQLPALPGEPMHPPSGKPSRTPVALATPTAIADHDGPKAPPWWIWALCMGGALWCAILLT